MIHSWSSFSHPPLLPLWSVNRLAGNHLPESWESIVFGDLILSIWTRLINNTSLGNLPLWHRLPCRPPPAARQHGQACECVCVFARVCVCVCVWLQLVIRMLLSVALWWLYCVLSRRWSMGRMCDSGREGVCDGQGAGHNAFNWRREPPCWQTDNPGGIPGGVCVWERDTQLSHESSTGTGRVTNLWPFLKRHQSLTVCWITLGSRSCKQSQSDWNNSWWL